MRRTNRVEPINIGAQGLARAIMITTTQLEIIRRVEITPIERESTDRVDEPRVNASIKRSRKLLWCICCLFIAAGILALAIVVTGLTILFGRMNAMKKSNIERYDLGDLYYGIDNVKYPSNTYLSNINKEFIQKYLSDQLRNETGFLGLAIDGVFVQDKLDTNKRKQRDTSCSIIFILQNIQVYFNHCSTCINRRNLVLRRLFCNTTAFQQPFYLLLNSRHIFTQICSTPNISHLIVPKRLNISYVQKLNTDLKTSSSTLSPLIINLQIDSSMSIDTSTTYDSKSTTDLIETTSTDNFEELTSFTTDPLSIITRLDSSQTFSDSQTSSYIEDTTQASTYISTSTKLATSQTETSFRKTTSNVFQFLPFRPSTTILPWRLMTQRYNNSYAVITDKKK